MFAAEDVAADCALEQDASAQFGYAFDGFALVRQPRSATDRFPRASIACNGHVAPVADGTEAYHYHALETFPNLPPCLVGVQAQDNFSTTATAGIGAHRAGEDGRNEPPRPGGGGPGGMPPGFEEAAATLGVEPQALMEALGGPGQRT